MMIKRLGLFLACCLLSLSARAETAPPLYQVEILVFETGALRGWTEEFWPWPPKVERAVTNTSGTQTDNILTEGSEPTSQTDQQTEQLDAVPTPDAQTPPPELSHNDQADQDDYEEILSPPYYLDDILLGERPQQPEWLSQVKSVDASHFMLANALTRLTPEKGYRVILHRAWIQPAIQKALSKPFLIDAETEQGDHLVGSVRFYKNRYAHIVFDLTLQRRIPQSVRQAFSEHENLPIDALPERWPFEIHAERKIRSGQWHYIDHPIFGILVTIRKVE